MDNKTYSKLIGCNIHGHIRVSPTALKIIDTEEFQRLRFIGQLGLCKYVYPAATHTRFEHSIGVYYLTGLVVNKLQADYPDKLYLLPELGAKPIRLTNFVAELIRIGGLCHDIGHGPFSHIFDDILVEKRLGDNSCHENRSCHIMEQICLRELGSELNESHIKFIKSIINPQVQHVGAIYQIVSNYLNGIDVDKFDYLARDTYVLGLKRGFDPRRIIDEIIIDNKDNIAYAKHSASEIYDMFHVRYMMHKQVYNHKASKIIEIMIKDIFLKIDNIFGISDSVNDMRKFCKFTDTSIFDMMEMIVNPIAQIKPILTVTEEKNILDAYEIYQNIIKRKLYKIVSQISNEDPTHFEKFLFYLSEQNVQTTNLQIISMKFGFVSGNKKNPFDSIYFYDKKEMNDNSFLLDKKKISSMMCDNYQETHHLLLCKDRTIYSLVMSYYKLFESI